MDKTVKILLIEDEVLNAMSLILDLKKHGYSNSKFVPTREKAFASVKEEMPDLIISDIALSGDVSGIDTVLEIIGDDRIPVIFTSGYEIADLAERMEKVKNHYFLKKPVKLTELLGIIKGL